MSYESLHDSEQKSMRHLARTVLDQLTTGRPADDVIRELHGNGWPLEEAREFVSKMEEQRGQVSTSLEVQFPDLKPVRHQPALFTINGIGTGLYGARDRDAATGTYVKTWCVCLVFVPIVALGAYRLAAAPNGGWYLVGKVPLSRLARLWNWGLLVGILALVGVGFWGSYTQSPEYAAREKARRADKALEAGELVNASRLYAELGQGHTRYATGARQQLEAIVTSPVLAELAPADVTQIFELVDTVAGWNDAAPGLYQVGAKWVWEFAAHDPVEAMQLLHALWRLSKPEAQQLLTELLGGRCQELPLETARSVWEAALAVDKQSGPQEMVFEHGLAWIEKHSATDPRDALAMADFLAGQLTSPLEAWETTRRNLLEPAAAAHPNDVDLAVRLAAALETDGQADRIKPLLTPHRAQLGSGEGARLLGHILAGEGQFEDAYALLSAYLEPRLASLHDAQAHFERAIEACQQHELRLLQQGLAAGFDFDRYQTLNEQDQRAMVIEHFDKRLRESSSVKEARDRLLQHAAVVPAAIDLGIVTLRRAQALTDPESRRAELERAERTFLAVQGMAGEEETFRLHMGQVYYWLGKHEEGKKTFDELLASSNRSSEPLVAVAQVLREVGSFGEARALSEEAYGKATDDAARYAAASVRANTSTSLKDEITWLERCDSSQPNVQAELQASRGHEARNAGDLQGAARHFREAIATYDSMNETSASLNNSGLICLALVGVVADPTVLDDAIRRFERATALTPDSAILMSNAAAALVQAVIRDLAGVETECAGVFTDFDTLDFVVGSDAELEQLRDKARHHAGLRKALAFYEKTMILAPRSPDTFSRALQVYRFLRDEEALRQMAQRVEHATFDTQEQTDQYLQFYRYQEDEEARTQYLQKVAASQESVAKCRAAQQPRAMAASAGELIQYTSLLPDIAAVDADQLIQLAEETHAAAPSLGTFSALTAALLLRADQTLAKTFPEYAEAACSARRSLAPLTIIAFVLPHQTALGEAARQNADVQRAASLLKERIQQFPSSASESSWAMLQTLDAQAAADAAQRIKNDPVDPLVRDCYMRLMPCTASSACAEYWARLAAGQTETARDALQGVIDLGVPLPEYLLGEAGR